MSWAVVFAALVWSAFTFCIGWAARGEVNAGCEVCDAEAEEGDRTSRAYRVELRVIDGGRVA